MVSSLGIICGILIYHKFLRNVDIKDQLFVATILASTVGMSSILLVTQENRILGLPDKAFAMVDNFFFLVIHELCYIPILIFASRICPKSCEGTMYAVFTSVQNLSYMVSLWFGGLMINAVGVSQDNFDRLWVLILIQNIWILLPLPFLNNIDFLAAKEISQQEVSQMQIRQIEL